MYIEATVDNGRQNFKVKTADNVQNSLYGLMPSDLEFFWLSCCFRVLYRFEFICIYLFIFGKLLRFFYYYKFTTSQTKWIEILSKVIHSVSYSEVLCFIKPLHLIHSLHSLRACIGQCPHWPAEQSAAASRHFLDQQRATQLVCWASICS